MTKLQRHPQAEITGKQNPEKQPGAEQRFNSQNVSGLDSFHSQTKKESKS